MSIYTHGWESDPRRDGCDSCLDLRNEAERQSEIIKRLKDEWAVCKEGRETENNAWRRAFNELSARHLQALSDIETLRTAADRLTAAEALRNIVLTEEQMALIPGHPEAASAPSPGPDSP